MGSEMCIRDSCLSSLNIEKYDEWSNNKVFIEDVMRFLDLSLIHI